MILRTSLFFIFCLSLNPAPSFAALHDPFNTQSELPVMRPDKCVAPEVNTTLDLLHAIDIALCNNPTTQQTWANAKAAAAQAGKARTAYLPTLTIDNTVQRNTSDGSSDYTSYGPEASLSYLLYDFGGREASVAATKEYMLYAGWNYSSTLQALVFQVIKGYLGVFTAQESLEASHKTEAASKEAFEAAKARLDVGLVTPADTAQAETAYAQTVLAREKAENDLRLATGQFAVLLHLSPTTVIELVPINPDTASFTLQEQNITDLIEKALTQRPDLLASRALEAQANAELRRARALDYPSLSVLGSAADTHYSGGNNIARDNATIGLHLSVPLFTGFSNRYQIQSAKYTAEAAIAGRNQAEDDVALDVWTRYHNYQTAGKTYTTVQTLLRSAEASEALAMGRYKAGKGTLIEALDAQARLADARKQWVEARYGLVITKYDLLRALGDGESLRSREDG